MLKDILEGKPLRHPIHTMLVHFPIGLLLFSFLLDLKIFISPGRSYLVRDSFYAMLCGLITALLAAIPGFVDYTDIRRDHPAKRVASTHLTLNLVVVALYAFNLGIRFPDLTESTVHLLPFLLSVVGIGLLSVSGYLGGRLVYDEGIAVGRHKRRTPTPKETLQLSIEQSLKADELRFVPVPGAEHLADGETMRVNLDGQILMIVRIDGNFYAVQEFCTHRFGPLSEGSFHGFDVQCPWHNSCFDVRTGKVTNGPAKIDLKTFKVEMRDRGVYLRVGGENASHDQKT